MTVDFQQVRRQVLQLAENAPRRAEELKNMRELAFQVLVKHAADQEALREKVQRAVRHDPTLRCALPGSEQLDARVPLRSSLRSATILAADGSQIIPDRHAEVSYGLINVGAIQMRYGAQEAAVTTIETRLLHDDQLDTPAGPLTEALLALQRDVAERDMLARLAKDAPPPVISFTDGPMELWGARDSRDSSTYRESLERYKEILQQLYSLQVSTAGYVDKPGAGLVARLLEIALAPESELPKIRDFHHFRAVSDRHLFQRLLEPGERSAIFAIQSQSTSQYKDQLALHFFYLNVGRSRRPHLARVEVPAWVALDPAKVDDLHSTLVAQCMMMGSQPYPYLLHRAHETAVVSLEEKEQVTNMIALELRKRGIEIDEHSSKQAIKNLPGRERHNL